MRWLLALIVVAAGLLVAGCEPTPEDQKNMQNRLPHGCKFYDLGYYNEVRRVIFIRCDGRIATSTSITYSTGKTTSQATVFSLEGDAP